MLCPRCGAEKVTWLEKPRVWKCYAKHEKPTFTLKTATIFEDSPIALEKWLPAVWLIVTCKNGISSYEIARDLGISQKSAWHMAHRIRFALHSGSFDKMLSGEVEVDETFIGGKARNMHVGKRARRITGRGGHDKVPVFGMSNLLVRSFRGPQPPTITPISIGTTFGFWSGQNAGHVRESAECRCRDVRCKSRSCCLLFGWRRRGRLIELRGVNRHIRFRRSQQHV